MQENSKKVNSSGSVGSSYKYIHVYSVYQQQSAIYSLSSWYIIVQCIAYHGLLIVNLIVLA